jgi:hypothetical protein
MINRARARMKEINETENSIVSVKPVVEVKKTSKVEKRKPIIGYEILVAINNDANDYQNLLLNNFENFNVILSDYIHKKKINIRDLELMLKREEERKEKEALMMQKHLNEQIDSVLTKANECFDRIKKLAKSSKVIEKPKQVVPKIVESKGNVFTKLADRCNTNLEVNENNISHYFSAITKNKETFKYLKSKAKKVQLTYKSSSKVFENLYNFNKNNKIQLQSDILYDELDKLVQMVSLISSELFLNLYKKVMLTNSKKIQKDEIYDIFSFWYLLAGIKGLIISKPYNPINVVNPMKNPITELILKNLNSLYDHFKGKEQENILTTEFYKIYDYILMSHKVKYMKLSIGLINELLSKKIFNKEEIYFFKHIHSLIINNSTYTYQISK